jgi:YD repeat-containing protein
LKTATAKELGDGSRGFDFDDANQLIRITSTNSWKSEFTYDGFGRRRVRKEFVWHSGAWQTASETCYVYDGSWWSRSATETTGRWPITREGRI